MGSNIDVASRTIFVGDIDEGEANAAIKALHILVNAAPGEEVRVLVNSRGGDLVDGFAIYDALRTCGCHVTTESIGHCMSAGVIVAQAGDIRLAHQNSVTLLHNPSHVIEAESLSLEAWGRYSLAARRRIYDLLAKHTGRPAIYWRRVCSRGDRIYTAAEALAVGLYDSLIDHD